VSQPFPPADLPTTITRKSFLKSAFPVGSDSRMTYTIKHADWSWHIEPNSDGKGYLLRYKRPTDWAQCPTAYSTPEEAANAVASRKTGVPDWDNLDQKAPFPVLSSWLIDPSGSVRLPPALPDILPS
jgi:hypothetical protein